MNLFDIDTDLDALLIKFDTYQELGLEVPPQLIEDINLLSGDRENKILNVARMIKNLNGFINQIDIEKKKLIAKADSSQAKIDWLKNYLNMSVKEDEKFKDAVVSITWRKRSDELIYDPLKVEERFLKVETSVRKQDLKDALKAGEVIPYARLEPVLKKLLIVS